MPYHTKMDSPFTKVGLLEKFKEDDTDVEELSRIEESELLQSPKFKRLKHLSSSSSPRSSPSSPSKPSSSDSLQKSNNENNNLFESAPNLKFHPNEYLLKTPTKPKKVIPLKSFNKQLPLKFNLSSPTKIQTQNFHKVSLTPHQRLEKKHGRLLTTNDILASYDFKETIGRGAFASVYRAINKVTGDEVAVKEIFIEDDANIVELMSEIDLLKILKHKNIVKYHGFIRNDKRLLIFLEYCSGGSLRSLYKKTQPLSEKQVVEILKQVLKGLVYLHEKGVIHRDIKAANILITENGDVKLTDFGVSTQVTNNSIKTTAVIAGTPNWMAPEIITMDGKTTSSDIWSLGATVVELLTGEPLYPHLVDMAVIHAIVMDEHPPLPNFLSTGCKDFLLKCFEKQPSKRVKAHELLKHSWLKNSSQHLKSDATLFRCSQNRKHTELVERDFNSIKRFNTRKFLPLEINKFRDPKTESDSVGDELLDEFDRLELEDNFRSRTGRFDPVDSSTSREVKALLDTALGHPSDYQNIEKLYKHLKDNDQYAQTFHEENLIFKLLTWIEAKYSSDQTLLLIYLKLLHEMLKEVKEGPNDLVNFAGLPLISKFIHQKYDKDVRIQAITIIDLLFVHDEFNIRLFVQIGSLKLALKLLQEDFKKEKRFSLFIIDIIHKAYSKNLIPQENLELLLANCSNFLDWISVVLLQFINNNEASYVEKVIEIISKFQNSKIFQIKPIFLNSIFKVFERLSSKNKEVLIKFLQSLKTNQLPEESNLLRFLVKALKNISNSKPFNNNILSMICSIIFNSCHLNQERQLELIKLDIIPTFQYFLSLTLPCSEYIIPLFCELPFNGLLTDILLREKVSLVQDYLDLLIDPVWQANALDSILALYNSSNDDEIPSLLVVDESRLIVHSFLINDTLNYELYLEKLIKFLSLYTKSISVNRIRLNLFRSSDVIDAIFKRMERHCLDMVIYINLLKLLRLLVINNYDHKNYEKVLDHLENRQKHESPLADELIKEIQEMGKNKEQIMMKPPLKFVKSTPDLRIVSQK